MRVPVFDRSPANLGSIGPLPRTGHFHALASKREPSWWHAAGPPHEHAQRACAPCALRGPRAGKLETEPSPPSNGPTRGNLYTMPIDTKRVKTRFFCRSRGSTYPPTFDPLSKLSAQTERLNELAVAFDVDAGQVLEQTAAAANQQEQSTTAVVVVRVRLEMRSQLVDALGEHRDLNLGRARVVLGGRVLADDLLLFGSGERHELLLQ